MTKIIIELCGAAKRLMNVAGIDLRPFRAGPLVPELVPADDPKVAASFSSLGRVVQEEIPNLTTHVSITGYEKPAIKLNENLLKQFTAFPFLRDKYHESIVVHEIVHFFQVNHVHKTEKEDYPTPASDNPLYYNHKLEREAYFVQAMYYYDEMCLFNNENLALICNKFFEERKTTNFRYS